MSIGVGFRFGLGFAAAGLIFAAVFRKNTRVATVAGTQGSLVFPASDSADRLVTLEGRVPDVIEDPPGTVIFTKGGIYT